MKSLITILLSGMLALGCGKNLAGPGTDLLLQPPGGLYAYSADSTHVMLVWSASASASASDFAGYTVSWGSVKDTVGATTFSYLAGPLPQGLMQFSVMSRRSDSFTSTPVTIAWAPAYRFDNGMLVMVEADSPGGAAGINVGDQTTPPSVQILDKTSQASIAFYLRGGESGGALGLYSGFDFYQIWNVTMFSTMTTTAASLDTALAAFPDDATFIYDNIPVIDGVIYYAKVFTGPSEFHYVRIHVNLIPGQLHPNRDAIIRLSIQRVAGVPSASAGIPDRDFPCS
jgi:hypothetical protein